MKGFKIVWNLVTSERTLRRCLLGVEVVELVALASLIWYGYGSNNKWHTCVPMGNHGIIMLNLANFVLMRFVCSSGRLNFRFAMSLKFNAKYWQKFNECAIQTNNKLRNTFILRRSEWNIQIDSKSVIHCYNSIEFSRFLQSLIILRLYSNILLK